MCVMDINLRLLGYNIIFQNSSLSTISRNHFHHADALPHYNDVIMSKVASHITSLTIVYSTVYSGADERKHQSSAPLAFVWGIHRWPVDSPHKGPVTRKCFHLMTSSCSLLVLSMLNNDFQTVNGGQMIFVFIYFRELCVYAAYYDVRILYLLNMQIIEVNTNIYIYIYMLVRFKVLEYGTDS